MLPSTSEDRSRGDRLRRRLLKRPKIRIKKSPAARCFGGFFISRAEALEPVTGPSGEGEVKVGDGGEVDAGAEFGEDIDGGFGEAEVQSEGDAHAYPWFFMSPSVAVAVGAVVIVASAFTAVAALFSGDEVTSTGVHGELQAHTDGEAKLSCGPFTEGEFMQVLDVGVHVRAAVPSAAEREVEFTTVP